MSYFPNSSPPVPGKPRPQWKLVLIIAAIPLFPVVVAVVWYASTRMSNNTAVRKLEQEARQRGEPITMAELATNYPPVPDQENAAVALVQIWTKDEPERWAAFEAGAQELPTRPEKQYDPALPYLGANARKVPRDQALSAESLAVAELFLAESTAHRDAVRVALRKPHFHIKINFEAGPAALLPHLAQIKQEVASFRIEALIAAEKGNVPQAIQALEDANRVGQLLEREPTLLSQLVRVATLHITLDGLEQLVSRRQLTDDQLGRLQALLMRMELRGIIKSVLIYERPFCLCAFDPKMAAQILGDASGESAEEAANARRAFKTLEVAGLATPDRKLMLETFKQAILLAEQDTPESLQELEKLFEETVSSARRIPPKIVSATMLAAMPKAATKFASYEARRRAALTAIAVERFRLKHGGKLPSELTELAPAFLSTVPEDPFNGEPIRCKALNGGYTIYSVGPDREDNDGTEKSRTLSQDTDVTFVVQWRGSAPRATPSPQ